MVHLIVKHKVKNYEQFRKTFIENLKSQKNNGSLGGKILRSKSDKNEVWVVIEWDSLENFKKFAGASNPEESKKKGTVIGEPEGWVFEDAEEF